MACKRPADVPAFWAAVEQGAVPRCAVCTGVVRPNVVFFGEPLPSRYFELSQSDLEKADLLIVLGTSLTVHPFASMLSDVSMLTPRLLINRMPCGPFQLIGGEYPEHYFRDAIFLGECDQGTTQLAALLGFQQPAAASSG